MRDPLSVVGPSNVGAGTRNLAALLPLSPVLLRAEVNGTFFVSRGGVFVDDQLEVADMAAIDHVRRLLGLFVLNLRATGRAGPGH